MERKYSSKLGPWRHSYILHPRRDPCLCRCSGAYHHIPVRSSYQQQRLLFWADNVSFKRLSQPPECCLQSNSLNPGEKQTLVEEDSVERGCGEKGEREIERGRETERKRKRERERREKDRKKEGDRESARERARAYLMRKDGAQSKINAVTERRDQRWSWGLKTDGDRAGWK